MKSFIRRFPFGCATAAVVSALVLLGVAGCGAANQAALASAAVATGATTSKLVQDGQLFCAKATADGPLVVGLIDAVATMVGVGPVAILATGMTKGFVDGACAAIGAIPVSPPANSASAPQVAVVPPAL